ncbi:hypothetical protein SLA2020_289250 [Shorea laevis]
MPLSTCFSRNGKVLIIEFIKLPKYNEDTTELVLSLLKMEQDRQIAARGCGVGTHPLDVDMILYVERLVLPGASDTNKRDLYFTKPAQ